MSFLVQCLSIADEWFVVFIRFSSHAGMDFQVKMHEHQKE